MALLLDELSSTRDPKAVAILAKTIHRELRASGYGPREVMSLASELLGLVVAEIRGQRGAD
jgi:hypothetical protein